MIYVFTLINVELLIKPQRTDKLEQKKREIYCQLYAESTWVVNQVIAAVMFNMSFASMKSVVEEFVKLIFHHTL